MKANFWNFIHHQEGVLAADASVDINPNREPFNKETDNLIGHGYTTAQLNRPKKLLNEI